jgi:hypothetical protein
MAKTRSRSARAKPDDPGAPDPHRGDDRPSRFSAKRKAEVVVRLIRGESLEQLSRALDVPVEMLASWKSVFLEGGQNALKGQRFATRGGLIAELQAKIGELTLENEQLRQQQRRRAGSKARSKKGTTRSDR